MDIDQIDDWAILRTHAHSVTEAAYRLHTSTQTIRRLIREGLLPSTKIGNCYRIPGETLERLIREPKP